MTSHFEADTYRWMILLDGHKYSVCRLHAGSRKQTVGARIRVSSVGDVACDRVSHDKGLDVAK
jgi:hypothetical protein